MNLYNVIKENFISGEWKRISPKKIFALLQAQKPFEQKSILKILNSLEDDGVIVFLDGVYFAVEFSDLIKGTLRGNEKGFAFLIPENDGKDYFIPNRNLNGALHGDEVLVRKVENSIKGSSDEAEVVKILKRGIQTLSGTFYKDRGKAFVRPDDKNFFEDVYIKNEFTLNAKSGDKVLVKIIGYFKGYSPDGKVLEVFGKKNDLFAEENSLIKGSGFEEEFSKKVLSEVSKISQKVGENQLIGRLNFSDRLIVTIDGEDSRDFDDAVEVEKLTNGNYKLGVHIADVSEYVKPKTAIDDEALNRSTSVYFPDRVLPMLPMELSNGICSLNEGEVRLTLSCIMEIDNSGEVIDRQIVKSVITSKRRLTYTKVQAMLDGDESVINDCKDVYPMIILMGELQRILSKKRDERGSVDLDVKESHITYNNGEISVNPRESKRAYKIIEEFMVLTNETVAEFAFFQELPILYRVHEKPTVEKATAFVEFLKVLGVSVRWKKIHLVFYVKTELKINLFILS